eukprot:916180-Pelagomonas_calceolata.AAC.2
MAGAAVPKILLCYCLLGLAGGMAMSELGGQTSRSLLGDSPVRGREPLGLPPSGRVTPTSGPPSTPPQCPPADQASLPQICLTTVGKGCAWRLADEVRSRACVLLCPGMWMSELSGAGHAGMLLQKGCITRHHKCCREDAPQGTKSAAERLHHKASIEVLRKGCITRHQLKCYREAAPQGIKSAAERLHHKASKVLQRGCTTRHQDAGLKCCRGDAPQTASQVLQGGSVVAPGKHIYSII